MKNKSKVKITMLPADEIVVPMYMRNSIKNYLDKVKSLDFNKIHPLIVNYRNDKYYLIDGQNRLLALRKLYGDKVNVPTIVIRGLTYEQEALLYMHETALSELGCI